MADVLCWLGIISSALAVVIDGNTHQRLRWPLQAFAVAQLTAAVGLRLGHAPVWAQTVYLLSAAAGWWLASKRPPSDRGRRLAAKLRGYKARAALARLAEA